MSEGAFRSDHDAALARVDALEHELRQAKEALQQQLAFAAVDRAATPERDTVPRIVNDSAIAELIEDANVKARRDARARAAVDDGSATLRMGRRRRTYTGDSDRLLTLKVAVAFYSCMIVFMAAMTLAMWLLFEILFGVFGAR